MSDERELEREAQALQAAYRKLPRVEPPAALDRAVLAQARAELTRQRPEAARRPRWLLPVGLAATAVLAIGVAWRMDKQPEDRWPSRPAAPTAEQPAAPPAPRANVTADGPAPTANELDAKRKSEDVAGLESKPDAGRLRDKDAAGKAAPVEGELKQDRATPKLQELRRAAPPPPAVTNAPAALPETPLESAPAPEPAQEPFPGRDDGAGAKEEASDAEREALAQPAPRAPAAAPAPRVDALDAARERSAPAKKAPSGQTLAAPASTAATRAPVDARRQTQVEVQGTRVPETFEQAPSQPKSAAAERASGGALGKSRTEDSSQTAAGQAPITDADREQPDAWLEAIRRVVAGGDEPQARRELRAFQRRHPDYPVPDDLARLLE